MEGRHPLSIRRDESLLARAIALGLFVVVAAGAWDVWWHGAVGRDTFWEPPHILLQVAVIGVIAAGWTGWVRTRAQPWKRLAIAALIVPLAAPFDELSHRVFGVESLNSAVVVWSPPHLVLVGGLIVALILVTGLLQTDQDTIARFLLTALTLAALLQLLLFLFLPLAPLSLYRLVGFVGAAFPAFGLALVLIAARILIPAAGMASLVTASFVVLLAMTFGERLAPGVIVPPHPHPPPWLQIFSLVVPALLIDLMGDRWTHAVAGGAVGLLSAGLLYGFAPPFIEAQFQYTTLDAVTAILAAAAGGSFGGVLSARSARLLGPASPT